MYPCTYYVIDWMCLHSSNLFMVHYHYLYLLECHYLIFIPAYSLCGNFQKSISFKSLCRSYSTRIKMSSISWKENQNNNRHHSWPKWFCNYWSNLFPKSVYYTESFNTWWATSSQCNIAGQMGDIRYVYIFDLHQR